MAELIRRGKGQRILVVTPKSILAQFQQEIWSRFSIPLVRLDSQGIARIREKIPSNKNPFEYYDKVIVSIDTLKNNGKFRHFLEKIHWDIVAIDECHLVANASSQRAGLADFLSKRTEAMVLTSATPHNGKKENFANLIRLLDPTAIPYDGDFTAEDIRPLYVRRFKKDIEEEVGDAFRNRETIPLFSHLFPEEEEVLALIQGFKEEAYEESKGDLSFGSLLFSIGLFKAYMSSPEACLETTENRLVKDNDGEAPKALLQTLKAKLKKLILSERDAKYCSLKTHLESIGWKGRKQDDRIIIFTERRATLRALEKKLKRDFELSGDAVALFHGSLTDMQQQKVIEDFSKEDINIRIFLSSDAGSQGVNLHYHCHLMFNYDIPWSIITLDQRNGRIDRFGQKEIPLIYYLIARSENEKVQGDIRIIEKLKEKEEEVHKSLGDAGSVWKLFDAYEEEKKVTHAIAKSDGSVLDTSVDVEEMDWLDVFGLSDEPKENEKPDIFFDQGFTSFYQDDYAYYSNLVDEILAREGNLAGRFIKDDRDKILEITPGKELSPNGILYDIPSEGFPTKKENFKLTTRKELVEAAIEEARRKKGDWPAFQLLYDLHPIARWLQFKLLAKVDKGKALVARMRQPLPDQSAWFVFQGITSNGQGKPILSKSFVIGRSFTGQSVGSLDSFAEFVTEYRLLDSLPALEIPEGHIREIQTMLPNAVNTALRMYQHKLQGDLEDEMEEKFERYSAKLNKWIQASERQLELKFGEEERSNSNNRRKEINYVYSQMNKFYEEYFLLENDPFLRLLAVFYHA